MFVNANEPMFAQEVSYVVNQMLSDPRGEHGPSQVHVGMVRAPGQFNGWPGSWLVGISSTSAVRSGSASPPKEAGLTAWFHRLRLLTKSYANR